MALLFYFKFYLNLAMAFYWIKTNRLIKRVFSKYVWEIPNSEKIVYLTFDDGPTPEITTWTLAQLKIHNAKATFFCIGDNIEKYPDIFQTILQDGHAVGNHTFNHLNGWQTETTAYLKNFERCSLAISKLKIGNQNTKLFRPPYGKIKKSQAEKIIALGYKIILWDVLSADFDTTITPEKCLKNVLENLKSGSIIVFHDSVKSFQNLEYALPKTLAYLKENGFRCEAIQ